MIEEGELVVGVVVVVLVVVGAELGGGGWEQGVRRCERWEGGLGREAYLEETKKAKPKHEIQNKTAGILGHVNLQFYIDYLLLGIKVREILPLTRLR